MNKKYFVVVGLLFLGQLMNAQHDHNHDHDDDKGHMHHTNEIGIANSPVYFLKEKEFAYGLHIHYIRQIKGSDFGLGLGYERIFDEHMHNTIGLVASYRIIDALVFNLAPGITFEESIMNEINFAMHVEATYEFEIGNFHVGPVLEFAYDPEDIHISLGLHIGYGF